MCQCLPTPQFGHATFKPWKTPFTMPTSCPVSTESFGPFTRLIPTEEWVWMTTKSWPLWLQAASGMKWDTAAADVIQNVAKRGLRTQCQIIAGSTNNGSFHMGLLFVEIIVMEHSVSVLTPINCDFIYLCNAFISCSGWREGDHATMSIRSVCTHAQLQHLSLSCSTITTEIHLVKLQPLIDKHTFSRKARFQGWLKLANFLIS